MVFAVPMAFFAFRLHGAYFAIGTWVVADIARLLAGQWKALCGGTGTSLPKGTTKDMFGVQWVKDVLDVSSAAAADAVTYWLALVMALGHRRVHAVVGHDFGSPLAASNWRACSIALPQSRSAW